MKSKGRSTSIPAVHPIYSMKSIGISPGAPKLRPGTSTELEIINFSKDLVTISIMNVWWLFIINALWKIWWLLILMSKFMVNISIYFDHHERPGDYFHHDESEKQLGGVAIVFKVVFYKFTTIVFKVVRICPPPPGSALITFMAICLWHWAQLDVAAPRAPDKVKKDWILKVIFL